MSLRTPPLYQVHRDSGAEFTDFGGWEMPVSYAGISTEHSAVRESVGIFDVSHMSELEVRGPDATALMNHLTTNDVRDLDPGDAQYSCILNEDGHIIDDTVVYRDPDEDAYLFVPNAGHGAQMTDRWRTHAASIDADVTVTDVTDDLGLFAIQGPDAIETVDANAAGSIADVGRFSAVRTTIDGVECLVARTGYTGEDGVEVFVDVDRSRELWGAFEDVQPCGLGARDTLRLEAGLLLSGQDFDPETEPRTPFEAKLGFVVDDSKDDFVGKEALSIQAETGPEELLVGIHLNGRGVPRSGYEIHHDDERIGHVTSGTMSPTLSEPIGLGYVDADYASTGTSIAVDVRGRQVPATIVGQRFLDSLVDADETDDADDADDETHETDE
ncbi:glycine cleavage system aminomethyltransferase GcvT [Halopenitus sp. POP-27]|uniref:glycine cleavage system aminomethyltransferase GcvT n=1 Tax=Halopenitus sp. POP-27 TaxID=2994425 RepID=UPI0024699364|nr:glycine cleavage system aminomethyltransferase GcvT [Halopenitus sp. POP-27]